jgi:hypothetical protein
VTLIGYTMMCEQAGPSRWCATSPLPSEPVSTSRSSAITTSRDWRPKATPHMLAACLARPARPPQLPPVGRRHPDIGTRNVRAMPGQSREQSATAD